MKRGTIFFVTLLFISIIWTTFNPNLKKIVFNGFASLTYAPKIVSNFFGGYKKLVTLETELTYENEALKAKIFDYERRFLETPPAYKRFKYISSEVYSRYPFNNKDYLILDKGLYDHVTSSLPVLLGESILVGQVDDVYRYSSRVKTLFDTNLKFSVRIAGAGGTSQALFVGGNTPHVLYIDKNFDIKKGDVVYAASSDFPLGIKVGEVDEFYISGDSAFFEATVKIPYAIGEVRNVVVVFNK